ncbi:hypothetical protein [Streptomyces sp. BK239]|uniref:hypothetical protein n=1 Tax=Streptomyces sp. BK239 TaxID=2512155 RepID=UPI00102D1E81|nr:hypothetical protein [Streptomyces sp. BK239]RZU11837.1 hypothetical protein EV567_5218 [Streptomyces sp. BK239]
MHEHGSTPRHDPPTAHRTPATDRPSAPHRAPTPDSPTPPEPPPDGDDHRDDAAGPPDAATADRRHGSGPCGHARDP